MLYELLQEILFLKCHISPIDHQVPTSEFVMPVETLMWITNAGQHVDKRAVARMEFWCQYIRSLQQAFSTLKLVFQCLYCKKGGSVY